MSETFVWKYIVAPVGEPAWEEWQNAESFPTEPFSNKDFDPAVVARQIAKYMGLCEDSLLCLEDMFGNRHEVTVSAQRILSYECTAIKALGKRVDTARYAVKAGPDNKCGEYLGDNDGTCPQLSCIRNKNHEGLCDNVKGDEAEVVTPNKDPEEKPIQSRSI